MSETLYSVQWIHLEEIITKQDNELSGLIERKDINGLKKGLDTALAKLRTVEAMTEHEQKTLKPRVITILIRITSALKELISEEELKEIAEIIPIEHKQTVGVTL